MKVANQSKKKKIQNGLLQSNVVNSSKKMGILVVLVIATLASIAFVMNIGKKAEKTIDVLVLKDGAYRNQMITSDMVTTYPMLEAEYEKYAYVDNNGQSEYRLITSDDIGAVAGWYAAYPILANTPLERRQLTDKRIDNSDTVLYSFPGKDIVQLDVDSGSLNAFKTFLQPGDKLNIEAIYSDQVDKHTTDSYGNDVVEKVEVFRTETVFGNIMIADLINSKGDSILDIYSDYNSADAYTQNEDRNSETWQESVVPTALLVALSPKEKERYYQYLAKDNIKFRVSLPQRIQD